MDIRAAIRAEQGWRKWDDSTLAKKANISQPTFSRRMAGCDFKFEEISRIADAFKIPLSELVEFSERDDNKQETA
ncbi:helix-turn-helix domain-containing protein [Trueperella pyogenes]|uniref:helix-turn-helix domain-containing protein n=1 Tax=Trueperella pyogenes TaxID=1661 RepID=UPI00345DF7B4